MGEYGSKDDRGWERCPKCHGQVDGDESSWVYTCRECGWEGTDPEDPKDDLIACPRCKYWVGTDEERAWCLSSRCEWTGSTRDAYCGNAEG